MGFIFLLALLYLMFVVFAEIEFLHNRRKQFTFCIIKLFSWMLQYKARRKNYSCNQVQVSLFHQEECRKRKDSHSIIQIFQHPILLKTIIILIQQQQQLLLRINSVLLVLLRTHIKVSSKIMKTTMKSNSNSSKSEEIIKNNRNSCFSNNNRNFNS